MSMLCNGMYFETYLCFLLWTEIDITITSVAFSNLLLWIDLQNGACKCRPTYHIQREPMFSRRINQEIPALAHLCMHHRQKYTMTLMVKYNTSYWVPQKCCVCQCDTCFVNHFGLRIRWKHLFLSQTQNGVHVRSNKEKFPNTDFPSQNMSIMSSFASGFPECHIFWLRQ